MAGDTEIPPEFLQEEIRLGARGEWYHDGVPFSNRKLIELFHRSVRWNPDKHEYFLQVGKFRAPFVCEDTAYFVAALDDQLSPWKITFADGSNEPLKTDSVSVGSENQIYCVRSGGHRARFLGSAHQILMRHVVDDTSIIIDGTRVRLG